MKLFEGLKKTKDALAKKIAAIFYGKIDDDFIDELEMTLISADISVDLANEIIGDLLERARNENVKDINILKDMIRDEITEILNNAPAIDIKYPAVIMVVGVNGVGKTTTIGKLANYYSRMGKSVVVAAADTFRAAASSQLSVWAERNDVRIIKHGEGGDPSAVVFDAISSAKAKQTDVLIIDTAGRLQNKVNLMQELSKMSKVVDNNYSECNFYKFIVIDAVTGQNALSQVEAFNDSVGLDGVILTKLDGTAKGGIAITICGEYEIPILFVGIGEQLDDLEPFDADSFAAAII